MLRELWPTTFIGPNCSRLLLRLARLRLLTWHTATVCATLLFFLWVQGSEKPFMLLPCSADNNWTCAAYVTSCTVALTWTGHLSASYKYWTVWSRSGVEILTNENVANAFQRMPVTGKQFDFPKYYKFSIYSIWSMLPMVGWKFSCK